MLTRFALNNKSFILAILIACVLVGPFSFISHPSREDPKIEIRNASVIFQYPGLSAERVEDLITTKVEEKLREIAEIKHITSTSSVGQSQVDVEVHDGYSDMDQIWIDLRNKMGDVIHDLPDGTAGPLVFDDKGNVAMATIAITGDGFENWELREAAEDLRRLVYARVPGIRKVEFFGVREQRVFVDLDVVRLSQLGVAPQTIVDAISTQNVILPGGRIEAEGSTIIVEPTGDFGTLQDVENFAVRVNGVTFYLQDLATFRLAYADPPISPAAFNGREAVILSVSMIDNFDSFEFGGSLRSVVSSFEATMPLGMEFNYITYQPDEIEFAVFGVLNNLWQTIIIVLLVVVAFLGLRTGLIVGAMVPLVMLMSVLIMRVLGIELERMSLASLIIALGLLVDNGIVVAEEIQARIQQGQDRLAAGLEAGRSLSTPLLAASLTTVLAFMPLMLAPGSAGEYTRSISLVIAIALFVSWFVALMLLVMFCVWFMKSDTANDKKALYSGRVYRIYRSVLTMAIKARYLVILGAIGSLFFGAWLFQFTSKTFFPASERTQLQIIVDMPVGANSYATQDAVDTLTRWLMDKERNPEVVSAAAYIASGGPRFYLSLEPIDGFPNVAYLLVNVERSEDVQILKQKVEEFGVAGLSEAQLSAKPMSMGPGEAGLVEFRIVGEDTGVLITAAERLKQILRAVPGSRDVQHDWENPSLTIEVRVDQTAARRAGVTSQQIANALESQLSGLTVSDYRLGDNAIPIVLRAQGDQRTNIDRLRTLNVGLDGDNPVPLLQVATFEGVPSYSRIQRRDLERVVTVSGKSTLYTAVGLDSHVAPEVQALIDALPADYRIEKGGEIEDSATAQGNLFANLPLAFALMVLVLIWQFDSFKKPLIIILTIPLVITGVSGALLIAPGANFSFMGILGFLALMGIVVNNAIVLIDRIEVERESGRPMRQAIVEAGVQRLQPIVMTTCTTALGLAPIILSRDVLFYDLAVVIAGGLIVGTVLTLLVCPCLYAVFFKDNPKPALKEQ